MIVNRFRFKIASLVFTYLLFLPGHPGTAIAIPLLASNNIQAKLPWVRKQGASKAHGVIVFVHGVLGNDFTSWQNGSSYWPELLIHDQTFDGQDIYVYKYPSPKLGKSFSISEIADNLRLVLSTDGVLKYKQITFVSHSMGGLVTRDFIVKYQSQVVPKIRLLAFFATPTTGTPYARLGALISKNPQFGQMYPLESDNYLGTLQSNWLAGNFKIRSYCAYEVLPTLGQIIVDQASATNLCTEHLEPINANHIDIVKVQDAKSEAYRVLVSAFEETAQGSRSSLRRTDAIHRESLESVQRAFINFVDVDISIPPPFDKSPERLWTFRAVVENSGSTPAIERFGFFMAHNAMPPSQRTGPSEEWFWGHKEVWTGPGIIGPKAKDFLGPVQWPEAYVIGYSSLAEVGSDKFQKEFLQFFQTQRWFVWGWIGYKDVFPNTEPHVTEFCKFIIGVEIDRNLKSSFKFHDCPDHNCTDKDCADYDQIVALTRKRKQAPPN
jgi:pimeloyl-ACP methyl ester carboxylesterase